ncbi:MAG: winged helix-turn-helix domain-containing protein [Caldilineaceae bacterium]
MPRTLRLNDGSYMRRPDLHNVMHYLNAMQCVEVVGFSNIGKSAFMRLLGQSDVWVQELGEAGEKILPVYIDCNLMLDMSDQGFYEVVLRCLRERSSELSKLDDLTHAYNALVNAASSDFQMPLSFSQGLSAVLQSTQRRLVLLFDEFDEPFTQMDPRVMLNLRALKDRHSNDLAYVAAMVKPMGSHINNGEHRSEFRELFNHRTWHLAPLTRSDVDRVIRGYMGAYEARFIASDFDFIYKWAGGHPCLLESACRMLDEEVANYAPNGNEPEAHWEVHRQAAKKFRHNSSINYECAKIWEGCSQAEQQALQAFGAGRDDIEAEVLAGLYRQHILFRVEGKPQFFCRLLAEYVQRLGSQQPPESASLWVNVDSGEVLVDGQPIETLTNLEYRLMLLLFQNAEKIIDKYEIVTNVWGDSYINEVDDARIEKLVSRLRQKIEPDPSNPIFLTTVRGRGYRLLLS